MQKVKAASEHYPHQMQSAMIAEEDTHASLLHSACCTTGCRNALCYPYPAKAATPPSAPCVGLTGFEILCQWSLQHRPSLECYTEAIQKPPRIFLYGSNTMLMTPSSSAE